MGYAPSVLDVLFSINFMPYVMATLRMSKRSGQIELKSCVHFTEGIANCVTWMVANCAESTDT